MSATDAPQQIASPAPRRMSPRRLGRAERAGDVAPRAAVASRRRSALSADRIAELGFAALNVLPLLGAMALAGSWSAAGWTYAVGAAAVLAACGSLRLRLTLGALGELPALVRQLATPGLGVLPWAAAGMLSPAVALQILIGIVALALCRAGAYGIVRTLRRRGVLRERAVIVGAGRLATEIAALLRDHPEHGLVPVGFVDALPAHERSKLPLPLLGELANLHAVLREFEVQRAIVAFGPVRESDWVGVLRTAVRNDVDVHIVPRFFDVGVAPMGAGGDDLRGIPLYRVRRSALRTGSWHVKRVVDVLLAGTALLIAAPLLGVLALAVRLSSPGPILFRQVRTGQDGREIEVPKFRSMYVRHASDTTWQASASDQTPVGRLLRRTSLDELPQLWSVLRGDMSLVGPRPERPHFVRQFSLDIPGYGDRHRLPVGLTGWAQVHGLRGDTSLRERARFDNAYIEHWSLWLDLVVLARTVGALLRDARANTGRE